MSKSDGVEVANGLRDRVIWNERQDCPASAIAVSEIVAALKAVTLLHALLDRSRHACNPMGEAAPDVSDPSPVGENDVRISLYVGAITVIRQTDPA